MKIILANKFYYHRGGAEIYMIELEKLLKDNGHEVAVFSMQHPLNLPSEFSDYFPPQVEFVNKISKNLYSIIRRPFGTYFVRARFTRLLNDFKPDIVHLNNIHTQLSPILAQIAYKHKIKVLWTLHDHKPLCPRYDCTRNGKPCELCFYNKIYCLRYKCMKNSWMASLLAYAEALVWNKRRLSKITDIFICPSSFLMNNMIKGGFKPEKLLTIPNFLLDQKFSKSLIEKKDHYCYIGRLSPEKGVETLLKAAAELPNYKLKIVGSGILEESLKSKYKYENIEFCGFQNWDKVKEIVGGAQFMVLPSECYENNPLSIIESLCLGTPVLGARIGGIPELIQEGINGFTFIAGNKDDLKSKIESTFKSIGIFDNIGIAKSAAAKFNSSNYYTQLINLYESLLSDTSKGVISKPAN